MQGREAIVDFLHKKWAKEKDYRLRKELFAFTDNKVRSPLFFFLPCLPHGVKKANETKCMNTQMQQAKDS